MERLPTAAPRPGPTDKDPFGWPRSGRWKASAGGDVAPDQGAELRAHALQARPARQDRASETTSRPPQAGSRPLHYSLRLCFTHLPGHRYSRPEGPVARPVSVRRAQTYIADLSTSMLTQGPRPHDHLTRARTRSTTGEQPQLLPAGQEVVSMNARVGHQLISQCYVEPVRDRVHSGCRRSIRAAPAEASRGQRRRAASGCRTPRQRRDRSRRRSAPERPRRTRRMHADRRTPSHCQGPSHRLDQMSGRSRFVGRRAPPGALRVEQVPARLGGPTKCTQATDHRAQVGSLDRIEVPSSWMMIVPSSQARPLVAFDISTIDQQARATNSTCSSPMLNSGQMIGRRSHRRRSSWPARESSTCHLSENSAPSDASSPRPRHEVPGSSSETQICSLAFNFTNRLAGCRWTSRTHRS